MFLGILKRQDLCVFQDNKVQCVEWHLSRADSSQKGKGQLTKLPEGQRGSGVDQVGCVVLWLPQKPGSFAVLGLYVFTPSRNVTGHKDSHKSVCRSCTILEAEEQKLISSLSIVKGLNLGERQIHLCLLLVVCKLLHA